MKVVCINDKNKPKQIPFNKWIKEGEQYTVIFATPLNIQKNKLGYQLKEIDLDKSCFPYHYFDSSRFKELDTSSAVKAEEQEIDLQEI
jgi:hypothetical protein